VDFLSEKSNKQSNCSFTLQSVSDNNQQQREQLNQQAFGGFFVTPEKLDAFTILNNER